MNHSGLFNINQLTSRFNKTLSHISLPYNVGPNYKAHPTNGSRTSIVCAITQGPTQTANSDQQISQTNMLSQKQIALYVVWGKPLQERSSVWVGDSPIILPFLTHNFIPHHLCNRSIWSTRWPSAIFLQPSNRSSSFHTNRWRCHPRQTPKCMQREAAVVRVTFKQHKFVLFYQFRGWPYPGWYRRR